VNLEQNENISDKSNFYQIFPNPATNNIQIKILDDKSSTNKIIVTDITGKTILCLSSDEEIIKDVTISTSQWKPGLYFINFYNGCKFIESQKVLITK
jgi:hypothetical protein